MKPINSKERSKLFWQFFFIFVALCILPVAIIFYAYYETPIKMNDADQQRLASYSAFEHNQKVLAKQLADIDSNIRLINNGSNADPDVTKNNILTGINNVKQIDTTKLIQTIAAGYTNYFTAAKNLNATNSEAKKATNEMQKTQETLNKLNEQKAQADAITSGMKSLVH